MALQAYVHDLACEMLSVDELPLDLRNYLDEVEMYANLAGGSIQSRQVTAIALVTFIDRKTLLEKIEDLERRLGLDNE